jgi:hypothetical protein
MPKKKDNEKPNVGQPERMPREGTPEFQQWMIDQESKSKKKK